MNRREECIQVIGARASRKEVNRKVKMLVYG
jgi:hypothetical protein